MFEEGAAGLGERGGNGGTGGRGDKAERERKERWGRGRKRWRIQGKCAQIVQERQMGRKCRNSTKGKGTSRIEYVAITVL